MGFLLGASAFAEDAPSKGHFFILTRHCEAEDHDLAETAPLEPPFLIQDTTTPGCNDWEYNFFLKADFATGHTRYEFPVADINYGLADNFQFKIEVPILNVEVNDAFRSAIGNTVAGIKYRFYENDANGSSFAVYPQLEFGTPWSNAVDREVVDSGTIFKFPLLYTAYLAHLPHGPMTLTVNFGYNFVSNDEIRNFISTGAALGVPVSKKASLLLEIETDQAVAPKADGSRDDLARIDIGTIITLRNKIALFGSLGESIGSSDDRTHAYLAAGVRLFR